MDWELRKGTMFVAQLAAPLTYEELEKILLITCIQMI